MKVKGIKTGSLDKVLTLKAYVKIYSNGDELDIFSILYKGHKNVTLIDVLELYENVSLKLIS